MTEPKTVAGGRPLPAPPRAAANGSGRVRGNGRGPEQPVALFVESPASAAAYLDVVERNVGLRWILTNNLETFERVLQHANDVVNLVVIDFQHGLTDKLKFYMQLCRSDGAQDIPCLLLPTAETRTQAERMLDRSIDRILQRPFEPSDIETLMGTMMRRSARRELEIRCWLMLEERMVEGRTIDLSTTGMGAVVPDPVLFAQVRIRLFSPQGGHEIDVEGHIRRKQRLSEGGYQLGIQFLRVLSGDVAAFSRGAGVDLTGLPSA